MSINLRGKGFAPDVDVEPAGEAVAERAGEGGSVLTELAVLVTRRVGPSDISLILDVETLLEGEAPKEGETAIGRATGSFNLITPAATPPATGKRTTPELTVEGCELEVLGAFLAFS
jgi:hypothetical protein